VLSATASPAPSAGYVGAIVGQLIGGAGGGAILTVIVGLIKNMMSSHQTP
jgi:hypothetical protein